MNTTMRKWTKAALAAMLVIGAGFNVQAQSVQNGSVWAPAGTKVDAKLTEWGQGLAANNKTTLLNYTVANDDKNIYLVVKSTDQNNNRKILAGGITFSINTGGKKKEEDAYTLTFPVINRESMRGMGGRRGNNGQQASTTPDSAAVANMRTALSGAKDITIRGFKDIQDSVISIYNEYSIKAAVGYDDSGNFIYELSVPLKLMGLEVGDAKQLAYNLKVNGVQLNRNRENRDNGGGGEGGGRGGFGGGGGGGFGGGGGGRGFGGGGGGGGRGNGGGGRGGFGGGGASMADMFSPTDFWGKYILAKKQ